MPFPAVCPECRATYTLSDSSRDKKVRCKECQTAFVAKEKRSAARTVLDAEEVLTVSEAVDDVVEEVDEVVDADSIVGLLPPKAPVTRRPAATVAAANSRPVRRRPDDEDEEEKVAASIPHPPGNHLPWLIGGGVAGLAILVAGAVAVALIFSQPAARPVEKEVEVAVAPAAVSPFLKPAPPPPAPVIVQPVIPPTFVDPAPSRPQETVVVNNNASGELSEAARLKVKAATVYIKVQMADGRRVSGTGFFGAVEAANIVITNAHVVGMLSPDARKPRSVDIVINSGEKDEKSISARVLGVDRFSDLAVLDIGTTFGMPPPLLVKSASNLKELDKLYVFGFPLGESLGKEITIRPSSVSSLRKKKKDGPLDKIQVNGGMDPGNSGGPVVDPEGQVVGVAVAGIEGRLINFAIPGDRVSAILSGRLAAMGTGLAYIDPSTNRIGLPIRMEMIDPRNLIEKAAVEVWTGDPGKPVEPSDVAPTPRSGDSKHERIELPYSAGVAVADVVMPELPEGKVYWLQPVYVTGGKTHWVAGTPKEVKREEAVERKPADLFIRHQSNTTRSLLLSVKNSFRVGTNEDDNDTQAAAMTTKTLLSENVASVQGGIATVRLNYRDAERELTIAGMKERLKNTLFEKVKPFYKDRLVGVLKIASNGDLLENGVDQAKLVSGVSGGNRPGVLPGRTLPGRRPTGPGTRPGVPQNGGVVAADESVQNLLDFHESTRLGLDSLAIPMPNMANVAAGFAWSGVRKLSIDTPGAIETGKLEMTYTYLGQRTRKGRREAVIKIEGVVKGNEKEETLGGRTNGIALLDLINGQISQADVRSVIDLEVELPGGKEIPVLATLDTHLERTF